MEHVKKNYPFISITAVLLLLLKHSLLSEVVVLKLVVLMGVCVLFNLANKGQATQCQSPF